MKILLSFILISLFSCSLIAQNKKIIHLKSETTYDQILPLSMLYENEEFKKGRLYYDDGGIVNRDFNYNLVTGTLVYKSNIGAILDVGLQDKIMMVLLDSCYFYPIKAGLGKVVYSIGDIELIQNKQTSLTNFKKEGAYGSVSSTTSIASISTVTGPNTGTKQLFVPGEYTFETKTIFYFKRGNDIMTADTKGLRKLFPDKRKEIDLLLKANKPDWKDKDYIVALLKDITNQ